MNKKQPIFRFWNLKKDRDVSYFMFMIHFIGITFVLRFWFIDINISFGLPFTFHALKGVRKTFWSKRKNGKFLRGLAIKLYFEDTLSTGVFFSPSYTGQFEYFSFSILGLHLTINAL